MSRPSGPIRARRWSRVEWRLPLSIACLLLAVVGFFSWSAYRGIRQTSVSAAEERVHELAGLLAQAFARSLESRAEELSEVAAHRPVVAALASRGEQTATAARPILLSLVESDPQIESLELWDDTGRLVLRVTGVSEDGAGVDPVFPAWAVETPVSGILTVGDTVLYEVAVPMGIEGSPGGYLLQRRRLNSAPDGRQLITGLMGMDTRLLIGSGGIWTDFERLVEAPNVGRTRAGEVAVMEGPDGRRRLGVGAPIPETAWRMWIDVPEDRVLAGPRGFLKQLLLVGLGVVVAGAATGWLLSRTVTVPLRGLATAAGRLADGDYRSRVAPQGADELGEVARAFNVMVERVGHVHERLEGQVRRRTAELERSANELRSTNEELEAFCYSVSHDLRAPLRSVHGFSEALLEDHREALDEQGRDYLDRVCGAADRMGRLIDDLLHLSRVSRAELTIEDVDLSDMAIEIVDEMRAAEPMRQIELAIHDGLGATGDPKLLRIALVNLLGNAWKFTGRRESAHVEFGLRSNGDGPAYFVRDNGAGFDMAHADQLFGPFRRLHRSDEFPGTGIGLAIVQRVVHRHGGRIWAEAKPDCGATFYFTLAGEGRADG